MDTTTVDTGRSALDALAGGHVTPSPPVTSSAVTVTPSRDGSISTICGVDMLRLATALVDNPETFRLLRTVVHFIADRAWVDATLIAIPERHDVAHILDRAGVGGQQAPRNSTAYASLVSLPKKWPACASVAGLDLAGFIAACVDALAVETASTLVRVSFTVPPAEERHIRAHARALAVFGERAGGGAFLVIDERRQRGQHVHGAVVLPGRWRPEAAPASVHALRTWWERETGATLSGRFIDTTMEVHGWCAFVDGSGPASLLGSRGLPAVIAYAVKKKPSGVARDLDADVFASGLFAAPWQATRAARVHASPGAGTETVVRSTPACCECGIALRDARRGRQMCEPKCRKRRQRRAERHSSRSHMPQAVTLTTATSPVDVPLSGFRVLWRGLVASFGRERAFTVEAAAAVLGRTDVALARDVLAALLVQLADEDGVLDRVADGFLIPSHTLRGRATP